VDERLEYHLAPYAVRSAASRGRVHDQPLDPLRGPFELDRHRIIESAAFRRLEHKTQVFAPSHHDHFRTRMTHTLEATQIARCLARALRVNEALAEAITLAHDLGHPPFGHAGEAALQELMTDHGGFNHNAHSVRVVTYLEHPFPAFRGLNLTRDTLDGLAAHATTYDTPTAFGPSGSARAGAAVSVEAHVASIADRVAYNCHDLEDAIGAGFVDLDDLAGVALWSETYSEIGRAREERPIHAIRRAVLDAMLDTLLGDAIAASQPLLAKVASPEAVCHTAGPLIFLSEGVEAKLATLERFLFERVYRHPDVAKTDLEGRAMVQSLFDAYHRQPDQMPERFSARIPDQGPGRVICDYIAGMTDRFCRTEHDRVVGQ
jgi:dGTPase